MSLISLENKDVFVFDWDGTILDSMQIKFATFSETLSERAASYSKDRNLQNKIKTMYQNLSGLPRKEIFKRILKELNIQYNLIDYNEFNNCLVKKNKKRLEAAEIFFDAKELIKNLIKAKKTIFISSSVPQDELSFFTNKKLGADLKNGISACFGSSSGFHKGEEHLDFIQKNMNCNKRQMIFIGDDLMDYKLSVRAGVDFILIDRNSTCNYQNIYSVSSLKNLGEIIK